MYHGIPFKTHDVIQDNPCLGQWTDGSTEIDATEPDTEWILLVLMYHTITLAVV